MGLQPALELDRPLVLTLLSKLGSTKFTQFLPVRCLSDALLLAAFAQIWCHLLSKYSANKVTKCSFLRSLCCQILDLITKTVPGMGGVGYRTELSNVPYSFSEDFVSAYRMHPFIPDEFTIDGDKVRPRSVSWHWTARNWVWGLGLGLGFRVLKVRPGQAPSGIEQRLGV